VKLIRLPTSVNAINITRLRLQGMDLRDRVSQKQ
jgi:hypothetical protein